MCLQSSDGKGKPSEILSDSLQVSEHLGNAVCVEAVVVCDSRLCENKSWHI